MPARPPLATTATASPVSCRSSMVCFPLPDGFPVAISCLTAHCRSRYLCRPDHPVRETLRHRHVVPVGDRGMITQTHIDAQIAPNRAPMDHRLEPPASCAPGRTPAPCSSRSSISAPVAITLADYPGERLIVCRNPVLAAERARKREELLAATERDLGRIAARVARCASRCAAGRRSAWRSARSSTSTRWPSTSTLAITDTSFTFTRNPAQIAAEAALDGLYACAPACPRPPLTTAPRHELQILARSSGPFGPSKPSI